MFVLSFGNLWTHHSYQVQEDAEEALSGVVACKRVLIDHQRSTYIWQRNRIARLARAAFGIQVNSTWTIRGRCALFMMSIHNEARDLLANSHAVKTLYLFDTWEPNWDSIRACLRSAKSVERVIFASSQSARHFKSHLDCDVAWVPQASKPPSIRVLPMGERKPTILNIGRRSAVIEPVISEVARRLGLQYLSQSDVEDIMFKGRAEFEDVLASARIVVVHPRNVDFPHVTGSVSMLTARYFEAAMSGAIVYGIKPESGEFDLVCPELPFVEFSGSLIRDLSNLEAELQQSERWIRAAAIARERHSWSSRFRDHRHLFE